MEKKKKKWAKPKLIVLVRGKPEEAVLEYCKSWEHKEGPIAERPDTPCGAVIPFKCEATTGT